MWQGPEVEAQRTDRVRPIECRMRVGNAHYGGARAQADWRATEGERRPHDDGAHERVGGWPFEEQTNRYNWRAVLDRLDALPRRALQRSPRLVLAAPALAGGRNEDRGGHRGCADGAGV